MSLFIIISYVAMIARSKLGDKPVKSLLSRDVSSIGGVDWKLHLVNRNDVQNAFVLATGDIFFFTGLLKVHAASVFGDVHYFLSLMELRQ